jgi:hypothetical protein
MRDSWRPILKSIVPPILLDNIKFRHKYGWSGDYSSWEDAQKDSVDMIVNLLWKS